MKKILLSSFLILALSPASKAQVTYGPELGLNVSNYIVTVPGFFAPTTVYVPGIHAGGVLDYGLSDNISIRPGAFFAINGIKYSYSFPLVGSIEFAAHINTIHIPVNVEYKLGEPGENRFFFGAGPFLGINLGGSASVSATGGTLIGGGTFDSSATISVGTDTSDYIKRFDFGIGVNAGYEFKSGLFIRAHFQRGLVNLTPLADMGYVTKSMNYGISVGYLFGDRPSKKEKAKTSARKK